MADSRVLPSFLLGCRWLQCDVEKLLEKPVAELSESLLCRYSRDGRRLSAPGLSIHFRQPIGLHRFASRGFGGEQYRSHPIPPEFWYALWGQSAGSAAMHEIRIRSNLQYKQLVQICTKHVPSWTCPNYEEHHNIPERTLFLGYLWCTCARTALWMNSERQILSPKTATAFARQGLGAHQKLWMMFMVDQNVLCHL